MAKRILLLAGEESGCFYAARLKEALVREQARRGEAGDFEFRGYGDYGFNAPAYFAYDNVVVEMPAEK